jgi:hypothetical protein
MWLAPHPESLHIARPTSGVFYGIATKAPDKRSNTTANQKSQPAGIAIASGNAIVVDDVTQLDDRAEYLI